MGSAKSGGKRQANHRILQHPTCNAPLVFRASWAIFEKFIAPRTAAKLVWLGKLKKSEKELGWNIK